MAGNLPIQVQGAGQPLGVNVRPHDNPPVGAEDLNRAQADKIQDSGGLAAVVLNRRYGERGGIQSALEYMIERTPNQDITLCTDNEQRWIAMIPEIADLAAANNPRYHQVREDAVKKFLQMKKQRKTDKDGANWRFRLPELALQKCPHLDSFDATSGAKFYSWKDVTLKQLERHHATSAHRLELTKALLDKKYLFLVSHCQQAEEIFTILEQKIPPKSEICRHLEDRIALGGLALGKDGADEMSLHRKAESVQVILSQLGLVEPDYDIAKSSVDSCLLSFGIGAGSHMEQARLTSSWYESKRTSNQFMSFSLDVWLETFKSALSGASATRVRAERLTLVDAAVKAAGSKQGRQGSKQGSKQKKTLVSQNTMPPPSAPPAPPSTAPPPTKGIKSTSHKTQFKESRICFVCSKPGEECKKLATCKCVVAWREKKAILPGNRCALCLRIKDGDHHRYSPSADTKVCHWRSFKDETRNYCCKHRISRHLCNECSGTSKEGKRPFSSQKRLSMKQVVSAQKQTSSLQQQASTPVLLPTVFQLREKVVVCDPYGHDQQALLVYDTGADHSMCSPGLMRCDNSDTDRVAHNVMIVGSVASQAYDLPIIQLNIQTKNGAVKSGKCLNLAVKEMAGEQQDPMLPTDLGQELDLKDSISEGDLELPIILLGIDYIGLHPVVCENNSIYKLPGLIYFKSRITEKILPVGRIAEMRSALDEENQMACERRAQAEQEDKTEVSKVSAEDKEEVSNISEKDSECEGNFCAPLSSLPAVKALAHDLMMSELRQTWGPVEQSAAISNVSRLGCMSCSPMPQALLDKQDVSFF